MGTLNVIGSILSIIAALFTVYQAIKAKKSAKAAVEAKESILKLKSTVDLHELLNHAKAIETLLVKLTAANPTTAKGRNHRKDHESLESFLSVLNSNQGIHPNQKFCDFVLREYEWLNTNLQYDPKPYNDILNHVRSIIREITRIIHDRTFE